MIDDPGTLFENAQPHRASLDLQPTALAHDGQQLIADRERAVVAGGHPSEGHVNLSPLTRVSRKERSLQWPHPRNRRLSARSWGRAE
jgi:hypothetical protein